MESKKKMPTPTLYVYQIHSSALTSRRANVDNLAHMLKTVCEKQGYQCILRVVSEKDPLDVQANIADYEKMVDYAKLNEINENEVNKALNALIHTMNLNEISNFMKHKEVWNDIVLNRYNAGPEDLFLVLEDDAFFIQSNINDFAQVLTDKRFTEWDMLFLGLNNQAEAENAPFQMYPIAEHILPSKESYFIRKGVALSLLTSCMKLKFNLKNHLSYWKSQTNYKIMTVNKRITIDGSKLGIVPSSLHENNILIYNREYMSMLQHMKSRPSAEWNLADIRQWYASIDNLKSPDAMHLMGVILCNSTPPQYEEGHAILYNATTEMQLKQGLLLNTSDLMNNFINSCQYAQKDLQDYLAKPSKYA